MVSEMTWPERSSRSPAAVESEQTNIAEQYPDIVKELLQIMDESHVEIPEISLLDNSNP